MRRLTYLLLFLFCFHISAHASSQQQLNQEILSLIKKTDSSLNIGVMVVDESTGKTLFSLHPNRSFVPASNMKVFTAVAALLDLKQDFTFPTTLYTDNKSIKQGHLKGSLYVKFTGDPQLTRQHFTKLIQQLKKRGISHIDGHVYIDDTQFGPKEMGPGWMWDDAILCYQAPISAVEIDHNCFKLWVTPKNRRRAAKLHSDNPHVTLINQLKHYSSKHRPCVINVSHQDNNRYLVSGCIPPRTNMLELSLKNPASYAKQLIKSTFKKTGIHYSKPIRIKKMPKKVRRLAEHQSESLQSLISTMLKESDNLIADSLLKTLGFYRSQKPGTWKNGQKAREAIFKEFELDFSQAVMVDGSGLSRYNQITPAHMIDLLNFVYQHFQVAYEFIAALPISGTDGTLHERLGNDIYRGKIRAKTGTMTHVSSLAGYIESANHHVLSFVILANGTKGSTSQYKRLEDKIVAHFVNWRG